MEMVRRFVHGKKIIYNIYEFRFIIIIGRQEIEIREREMNPHS